MVMNTWKVIETSIIPTCKQLKLVILKRAAACIHLQFICEDLCKDRPSLVAFRCLVLPQEYEKKLTLVGRCSKQDNS